MQELGLPEREFQRARNRAVPGAISMQSPLVTDGVPGPLPQLLSHPRFCDPGSLHSSGHPAGRDGASAVTNALEMKQELGGEKGF